MFYVMLRVSRKSGKPYAALYCDLGYRVAPVCFDRSVCSEILGISIRELMELPVDVKHEVA